MLLRTHFVDEGVYRNAYLPLEQALPENYKLVVVHDETKHPWDTNRFPVTDILRLTEDTMHALNPFHQRNWYNIDSLLAFIYDELPVFDYYWILEYDVRFSGDWSRFFSVQDRAGHEDALLVKGTWPYNGDASWWVWHELQWPGEKPLEERWAGFVYIGRYSRCLMRYVRESIGERSGFSEVYLATICHEFGLETASVSAGMIGSVCSTSASIDEQEYRRLSSLEPDRLFHKVK